MASIDCDGGDTILISRAAHFDSFSSQRMWETRTLSLQSVQVVPGHTVPQAGSLLTVPDLLRHPEERLGGHDLLDHSQGVVALAIQRHGGCNDSELRATRRNNNNLPSKSR